MNINKNNPNERALVLKEDKIKRRRRMTLIIGFKCEDSVVLVSDTKIIDSGGKEIFSSKLGNPISNPPVIVGAAGDVDLFREFGRKLPEIVYTHKKEIDAKNLKLLIDTGIDSKEALQRIYNKTYYPYYYGLPQLQQPQVASTPQTTYQYLLPPVDTKDITPYQYSTELLLDDCRELTKNLNHRMYDEVIDVLVGFKAPNTPEASLHLISHTGKEREVESYEAIGIGDGCAEMFFGRYYDSHKDDRNFLIKLAFLVIAYATYIARVSSIGWSREKPPEVAIVKNDGSYGILPIKNTYEVIEKIVAILKKDYFSLDEKFIEKETGGLNDLELQ
ncbi:MAG: hypothetical protein LVQ95_04335 [Candidatus Micrarchaeales archaeon]|nr:hypothetical protein [Candidatus Micrarchaeales archaeon]